MGARRDSQEFKDEAVKLVLDNGTAVRQAVRELGISEFTLRDWIKKAQSNNSKPGS
jgi:transposase-like protein